MARRRTAAPNSLGTVITRVNALHAQLEDLRRAGTASNATLSILTELVYVVAMLADDLAQGTI